ncbi:MAG: TatD family nuclease-associated radical SAM protein [Candidatus Bathyarchaeia archaeon]
MESAAGSPEVDTGDEMQGGSVVYRYTPRPHTIYLNITNQCSNSCIFCVRNYSLGLSGYRLWLDREPSIDEVWRKFKEEIKESDDEVVFCGFGEPTMRLDVVLELTRRLKRQYPNLRIRLNTDGLAQLRSKGRNVAEELRGAGLDSISISLNAENEQKYEMLCRPSLKGSYEAVLAFARDCRRYFPQVTLTVVDLAEVDLLECRRISRELGCEFRVR